VISVSVDLSLCVCVCVCVSVRNHIFGTPRPIFAKIYVQVSYAFQSSSSGVVICYVLPVLQRSAVHLQPWDWL